MTRVIVDLDGMRALDDCRILWRQAIPLRMRYRDEGAGLEAASRQVRRQLAGSVGRKIERQADGEDMPLLARLRCIGMDFGTDEGGEVTVAERSGIGDRVAVALEEVVRKADEVVAARPIAAAHV